jgi:hypothetical protein
MTRPDYVYVDEDQIRIDHRTQNGLSYNNRPDPIERSERMRIRGAAYRATKVYPGPVGELLCRELMTWEEFGYRLGTGGGALIYRLVEDIMNKSTVSHSVEENPSA